MLIDKIHEFQQDFHDASTNLGVWGLPLILMVRQDEEDTQMKLMLSLILSRILDLMLWEGDNAVLLHTTYFVDIDLKKIVQAPK